MSEHRRMRRERKTLEAMMRIYCRDHHGGGRALCGDCGELRDYALARLMRCPFQHEKPVCAKCPIHCYKPEMRVQVGKVMRYSGPRLMRHHPVLAFLHLYDKWTRESPERRGAERKSGPVPRDEK